MKTLLLLRHAKSDWSADFEHDRERPLNKRGKRAAKVMGRFLAAVGVPDRAITSSAVRAATTVELAANAGAWSCEVEVEDDLYETEPSHVVSLVQNHTGSSDSLLLVGHEPTFSATASLLIGGGELKMATAALAWIDLDVERWADVRPGSGTLVGLFPPKLVEGFFKDG